MEKNDHIEDQRNLSASWAVVFSGGGLRAAAHIGVIKAFEENDIFPDMIGGASTGGLIAAAYALGMKSEEILHFFAVQGVRLLGAADERINTEKSCAEERANALIQNGQTLQSILDEFFDQADFSQTKVPCHIVATDLTHGAEIVFSQGSIVNACRAAMSMPGLFYRIFTNNPLWLTDLSSTIYLSVFCVKKERKLSSVSMRRPVKRPEQRARTFQMF